MRNQIIRSKNFSRRALVLGGGKFLLLSALVSRLYYLQILESKKYSTMAEGNRIRLYPLLPSRGKILDRNGVILAEGNPRYQVLFDAPQKIVKGDPHMEGILKKVLDLLEFDDDKYNALLEDLYNGKNRDLLLIEDYLPWEKVAKIEVNAPELPGINVESPEVRNYPFAESLSHVIGYIGIPSKSDMGNSILFKNPDFKVGKTGFEKVLEKRLQGKAGIRQVEVNALGAHVRELQTKDGVAGEDVELTIDIELQNSLVELLSGKGGLNKEGGSAVVMDVKTGDVLAMASLPGYDTNKFIRGITTDEWKELLNDPDAPLNNKAMSLQYPPGSTFKPITALAALEEGVITKETQHKCPGYYKFGGRKFHCWNKNGHGYVNIEQAIMQSCNVFFYKISRDIGINNMAKMARKFSLGNLTGIELPGEKPGIMPDRDWKMGYIGEQWYQGETLNASIGQGYTLVTPLQLAVMTARIASGKKVQPHLIKENNLLQAEMVALDSGEKILLESNVSPFEPLDVNSRNLQLIRKGMDMVVNNRSGTVYFNRIEDRAHAFAGKTGTAQVISKKRFEHLPKAKEQRYHSIFIGYAPVDNPRYSVSVVVEHGGYGSAVAAPIGAKILKKVQELEETV